MAFGLGIPKATMGSYIRHAAEAWYGFLKKDEIPKICWPHEEKQ